MTTLVITQNPQFGGMANGMIAMLFALNNSIPRLNTAVGDASSGFTGTAGTEYEGPANPFGVVPDDTPGQQGQAYASAIVTIDQAWATFWQAAAGAIAALDSGQRQITAF